MDKLCIFKDLEASLERVSEDYQVFVGWDPENNQDVGWLSLEEGVKVDFNNFQLRDFRVRKSSEVKVEIKVLSEESDVKHEKLGTSSLENTDSQVTADGSVLKQSAVKFRSGHRNGQFSQCSHCYRFVKHLGLHEMKCKSKHAKGVDRVECPVCSFRVLKKGLTTHLKIHTRPRNVCPHCNGITKESLEQHKEKCLAAKGSFQTSVCKVCNKVIARRFFLEHIRQCHLNQNQGLEVDSGASEHCHDDKLNRSRYIVDDLASAEVFSEVVFSPACDDTQHARCRLKFKLMVKGKFVKKIVKSLSSNPVGKAMKKFAIHVGRTVEELEFRSKDYVLDGEELAGSIDRGSITVSLKVLDDKKDVNVDISAAACFDEISKDWLKNIIVSPNQEKCQDKPANQDESNLHFSASFNTTYAEVPGNAEDDAPVGEVNADELQLNVANSGETVLYEVQDIYLPESDSLVTNHIDEDEFNLFLEDSEEEMDVTKGLTKNSEIVVDFANF